MFLTERSCSLIDYMGLYLSNFACFLFFPSSPGLVFQEVARLVQDGIKSGIVQPLSYTAFSSEKAEEAFRFMSAGKHIGKVTFCSVRRECRKENN